MISNQKTELDHRKEGFYFKTVNTCSSLKYADSQTIFCMHISGHYFNISNILKY